MLIEVLAWGLKPALVTGDCWYSGATNLKTIRNHQTGFMFAIEKNRSVSLEKGDWQPVQNLDIPDSGLDVWLKDFGKVRLFRTTRKYISSDQVWTATAVELFTTPVRYTGVAISVNIEVGLFGGGTPYLLEFFHQQGIEWAPLLMMILAGALLSVAAGLCPLPLTIH